MIELLVPKDLYGAILGFYESFKAEPFNFKWLTPYMSKTYIEDIFNLPNFRGYKFIYNKEIIGYCLGDVTYGLPATQYNIKEIFIYPRFQHKGIGGEFISLIENDLTALGLKVISLHTSKSIPAYEFYKKNEFTEVSDTAHFLKPLS